jgi:hypothetical protein
MSISQYRCAIRLLNVILLLDIPVVHWSVWITQDGVSSQPTDNIAVMVDFNFSSVVGSADPYFIAKLDKKINFV